MDELVPLEERSAILDAEVMKYARMGYEVRSRTQTLRSSSSPRSSALFGRSCGYSSS
jgi:hypothetical protein